MGKYIDAFLSSPTQDGANFRSLANQVFFLNPNAYESSVNFIEAQQIPLNIAVLTMKIVLVQLQLDFACNPNRIFQGLTKNQKTDYNCVLEKYEAAEKKYREIKNGKDPNTAASINNEETKQEEPKQEEPKEEDAKELHPTISKQFSTTQQTKVENQLPDFDNMLCINKCTLPKQGWIVKVYCTSLEDYNETMMMLSKDISQTKASIYVTKEDVFQQEIAAQKFAIAAYIIANENFSFINLNDKTIEKLDEDVQNVKIDDDGIMVSDRIYIDFYKFTAKCYMHPDGTLSNTSPIINYKKLEPEKILEIIEDLGHTENPVKEKIEIETGFPSATTKQFYKAILIANEDIDFAKEVLADYDEYNIDFFVQTNSQDVSILFIHETHLIEVLKEFKEYEVSMIINPSIDEKICDFK